MEKRNRILKIAVPLMVILLGFILYDYGYLKIKGELSSIKEMEALKTKTLTKYVTLIAEKRRISVVSRLLP